MKYKTLSQIAFNPNATTATVVYNGLSMSVENGVKMSLIKANPIPSPIGLSYCVSILKPNVQVWIESKS